MKLTRTVLGLACLAFALASPATAAPVFSPAGAYIPNSQIVCVVDATAGYTNATTGATDITGASCALKATNGDFAKQFIETCFSADVTKATATTGSIGVYVNGALVTASKRFTSSAALQNTISQCYTVARSSGAAQTVKLQGVSGDTNTFTVAQCAMKVSLLLGL